MVIITKTLIYPPPPYECYRFKSNTLAVLTFKGKAGNPQPVSGHQIWAEVAAYIQYYLLKGGSNKCMRGCRVYSVLSLKGGIYQMYARFAVKNIHNFDCQETISNESPQTVSP